ncbi:NUDIX domain-containing protein, partial [Staphylococcus sp. SIMBA_130]
MVGGKIEDGEKGIDAAAYREVLEETNISRMEITLHHIMDFEYYLQDCYVEVYVGRLKRRVSFSDDETGIVFVYSKRRR